MACTYFAPNKQSSQLYDDLYRKYGHEVAKATYVYSRSQVFKNNFGNKVQYDANGEPTIASLEQENLVIRDFNSRGVTVPIDIQKREEEVKKERMKKISSAIFTNVDVVEDPTATESAKLTLSSNGKNQLIINPDLMVVESPYQELGYVITNIARSMQDIIVSNPVKMLKGSPLEQAIAYMNPSLTAKELENELLLVALGEPVEKLFPEDIERQKTWRRLVGIFTGKVSRALQMDEAEFKKVLPSLIRTRLVKSLINHHTAKDIAERDLRLVRDKFITTHAFLEKAALQIQLKLETHFAGMSQQQKAANQDYIDLELVKNQLLTAAQIDANKGIVEFLAYAIYQTNRLEQDMLNILQPIQQGVAPLFVKAEDIQRIINYNNMFGELLDDVLVLAEKNPQLKNLLESTVEIDVGIGTTPVLLPVTEGALNHIRSIRSRYLSVLDSAKEVGIIYIAHKAITGPTPSKFEVFLKNKLARQWNNDPANNVLLQNPKTRVEALKEREKYVKGELAAMKARPHDPDTGFYTFAKEYYLNNLQQGSRDLDWLERMFLSGNQLNDEHIQNATLLLDRADYNTRKNTQAKYRETVKIFEAFDQIRPQSNQFEKYEGMIENEIEYDEATGEVKVVEGKYTEHLTNEYYSAFFKIRATLGKAVQAAEDTYGVKSPEYNKAKNRYIRFMKMNTITITISGEKVKIPTKKWINPNFAKLKAMQGTKEDAVWQMFNYIRQSLIDDDAILPFSKQLNKIYPGNLYVTKLPSILRDGVVEIVGDKGFKGYIAHNARRVRATIAGKIEDDVEFGSDIVMDANGLMLVESDEQGRERHRVPVNFRQQIPIEDRSFDLASIMIMNHAMSVNYEEKSKIRHELELLEDVLASREVTIYQTEFGLGVRTKVNKLVQALGFKPSPLVRNGVDSEVYKAYQNLMRTRLYGIRRQGSVTANKIADALSAYTGTLYLGLNIFSGGANLLSGQLQNRIQAMSKDTISNAAMTRALATVTNPKEQLAVASDLGRAVPVSRTGLLMEALNPTSDWQPLFNTFNANNAFKKAFNNVGSDAFTSAGEHFIQSTMMYAILYSCKAIDANGDYLDADFNPTKDETKAISMDAAYSERKKDGSLRLHKSVKGFRNQHIEFTGSQKDVEFYLQRLIRETNKQLQGNYDINDVNEARTYAVGRLALVMRRWYPNTLVRRVRGMSTVFKDADDLTMDDVFVNTATQSIEEGYYTSFIRYFSAIYKEGKKMQLEEGRKGGIAFMQNLGYSVAGATVGLSSKQQGRVKSRMMEYEISNVAKARYEMFATAMYAMLAIAIKNLVGDLPEEDKRRIAAYYLSYWILKAQRELMSYYNPNEILRTVGTVSVTLKVAKDIMDFVVQLLDDVSGQFVHPGEIDRYKSGKSKGDSKLVKEFYDIIPFGKQLEKEIDEQYSYLLNIKGF